MKETIENKPIGFSSLKDIKSASEFLLLFTCLILTLNQDRHNEKLGTIITLKGIKTFGAKL